MQIKLSLIENFLNKTTMYRVVLYCLTGHAVVAIFLNSVGVLSYNTFDLVKSLITLILSCYIADLVFSKIFKIGSNIESTYITAYILFFILYPPSYLIEVIWVALCGVIAIASKYIVIFNKKHIFNPAAFGTLVINLLYPGIAVWWVGSYALFIPTIITAFLIIKKIRRLTLFLTTVIFSGSTVVALGLYHAVNLNDILMQQFMSWPIIFFAAVMVTEPLTAPPRKIQQIIYGALIGTISSWPFNIGHIYMTPELALLLANIYSFSVSVKRTFILKLKDKKELSTNTYEFTFLDENCKDLKFLPGQYLEFTLPHSNPDSRGIRRYFTIASSPTENVIKVGVKFALNSSSFKRSLLSLEEGSKEVKASSLYGDFVLPDDAREKLVFIAGGIGVTPFISMIKFLMDNNKKYDIVLFYANFSKNDIAYKDILNKAKEKAGVETVYIISDVNDKDWKGEKGYLSEEMIKRLVKDCNERTYYISGPNLMVENYKHLLTKMGIERRKIITDYFPGFA